MFFFFEREREREREVFFFVFSPPSTPPFLPFFLHFFRSSASTTSTSIVMSSTIPTSTSGSELEFLFLRVLSLAKKRKKIKKIKTLFFFLSFTKQIRPARVRRPGLHLLYRNQLPDQSLGLPRCRVRLAFDFFESFFVFLRAKRRRKNSHLDGKKIEKKSKNLFLAGPPSTP